MPNRHTVYIDAPVEKVFDFFKDPRNQFALAPDRRVQVTDVKMTNDGLGTYYSYAMKVAGLTREGFVVYTDFIANKRIVDRSSVAMHGSWTYGFEPEGTGTRLTMYGQSRSFWRIWPFSFLLDRVMTRRHDYWLKKLTETLEAASTTPPTAV
jgi:hypothetical protein